MVVRALLVWLLLCSVAFGQVDVGVVDAKVSVEKSTVFNTVIDIDGAKSVSEERQPGTITESVKPVGRVRVGGSLDGVSVIAFGKDFSQAEVTKFADGLWIISQPGTYLVVIQIPGEPVAFRPLVIPGAVDPPPVDPPVDPPPTGDFAELIKVAKVQLDAAPNKAAISAWGSALATASFPATLEECQRMAGDIRRDVLSRHPTNGLNGFIVAVDAWFASANLDRDGYVKALGELAKLMVTYKPSAVLTLPPVNQNCPDGFCPVPTPQNFAPAPRGFIFR